jgi:hypothetical protein
MNTSVKFKIIDKYLENDKTIVNWVCGVSNGVATSTGQGQVSLDSNYSENTDVELLKYALEKHGGDNFIKELHEYHEQNITVSIELLMQSDWYVAYEFYCNKVNLVMDNNVDAILNIKHGFGTYGLLYSHSIYNITNKDHWSNTFAYSQIENDSTVLYHIKVKDGVVVEWYKSSDSLVHNDDSVEWVALDLITGDVIEYYIRTEEINGLTQLYKFNANSDELDTVTTHGMIGALELPYEFQNELKSCDFKYDKGVFGYATKSYGKIIEYTLRECV